MNTGKLFVCGNQIGNLFDLPATTLATLQRCKSIVCDSKDRFINEIANPLGLDLSDKEVLAFEPELNNTDKIFEFVISKINSNSDVAFICDAGMPGVSDWGTQLVGEMQDNGIPVEIIPGPSILTTSIAVAGVATRTERIFYSGFMDNSAKEIFNVLELSKPLKPCLVLIDHPSKIGELIQIVDSVFNNPFMALCINITMPTQRIMRGNSKEIYEEYLKITNLDCFMTLVVDGS